MPQIAGIVGQAAPARGADAAAKMFRAGATGEQYANILLTGEQALVDEGAYFSAVNPTPGTGIAGAITTGFGATAGLLTLRNNAAASTKRLFPTYIRLINTVVPASATRTEALITLDNITRYSSGGTNLTALANRNMDSALASEAVLHFGALTLAAAGGSVRQVSRFQLRTAIEVQYEEYLILFGDPVAASAQTLNGSANQRNIVHVAPVVLGQGDSMQLHTWRPSNAVTGPTYEVEVGWFER